MLACKYDPSAQEAEAGESNSDASMAYLIRFYLQAQQKAHPAFHGRGTRELSALPFQGVQEIRHAGSEHRVRHVQGPTHHPEHDVRLLCLGKTPMSRYPREAWVSATPKKAEQLPTCTRSAMRWSSHPVSISLFWKLSVSRRFTRYSTVVRKSPRMDSSFKATTMLLERRNTHMVGFHTCPWFLGMSGMCLSQRLDGMTTLSVSTPHGLSNLTWVT